jgi:enamine deaminase RidA (YjgF/YER057c/UK114 family)
MPDFAAPRRAAASSSPSRFASEPAAGLSEYWSAISDRRAIMIVPRRIPRKESLMSAEARLKQLGLVLPLLPKPVANYLPYRLAGNLLFLAGQGPRDANGALLTGKLGANIGIEEGYRRARLVGLGLLAAMRDALGSLDRVEVIVKLLGMVNAVPDFNDSPKVINGCSDLFVEVFGDAGRHARSAVGNVMLPNQISVEIEGIVAVKT